MYRKSVHNNITSPGNTPATGIILDGVYESIINVSEINITVSGVQTNGASGIKLNYEYSNDGINFAISTEVNITTNYYSLKLAKSSYTMFRIVATVNVGNSVNYLNISTVFKNSLYIDSPKKVIVDSGLISIKDTLGNALTSVDGALTVGITGTVPVSGTFYQEYQGVSGTVAISNFPAFPANQVVSGSVSITGPLPEGSNFIGAVDINNPPIISAFNKVSVADTVVGQWYFIDDLGDTTNEQWLALGVEPVLYRTFKALNTGTPGTGIVVLQLYNENVVVKTSALPTGASTETTLSAINLKTPNLGLQEVVNSQPVCLSTAQLALLKAPATQPVSGPLTNAELRFSPVRLTIQPQNAWFFQTNVNNTGHIVTTQVGVTLKFLSVVSSYVSPLFYYIYNRNTLATNIDTAAFKFLVTANAPLNIPLNISFTVGIVVRCTTDKDGTTDPPLNSVFTNITLLYATQ